MTGGADPQPTQRRSAETLSIPGGVVANRARLPDCGSRSHPPPDYALYTAKQAQKGRPLEGQVPEGGIGCSRAAFGNAA